VWTALNNGDGTMSDPPWVRFFQPAGFVLPAFGVNNGWRVDRHPRLLADLTGDRRADIVGFGEAGVGTALSNGDGADLRAQGFRCDTIDFRTNAVYLWPRKRESALIPPTSTKT
jgi:hypothetical protein